MPVQTRYVVMRNDIEVKTFMDKKAADEYDKMLDMADSIVNILDSSPLSLSDDNKEQLSIYFAKQRESLLVALQAKKAKVPKPEKESKKAEKPVELKEVS